MAVRLLVASDLVRERVSRMGTAHSDASKASPFIHVTFIITSMRSNSGLIRATKKPPRYGRRLEKDSTTQEAAKRERGVEETRHVESDDDLPR